MSEVKDILQNLIADVHGELDISEDLCGSCQHLTMWYEPHPYGEGVALEPMVECDAKWSECPRIQEALQDLTRI